ncbi:MAG: YceI family protein [Flavobacteriaceae bacterium]
MKNIWIFLLFAPLVLVHGQSSPGETETTFIKSFKLDSGHSQFLIKGTSSLHDWEMVSESFSGTMNMDVSSEALSINEIKVSVGVTSLKSGKRIMDNKCYDALKKESHPTITYQFKKISSVSATGSGNYKANVSGTLTIAGTSKTVSIDVTISKTNNTIVIKGEKPLKMTDFGVEPPTALLGTLKTGDDITIVFNLNYQ